MCEFPPAPAMELRGWQVEEFISPEPRYFFADRITMEDLFLLCVSTENVSKVPFLIAFAWITLLYSVKLYIGLYIGLYELIT